MQAATSPARQARARHRHDLRVLTYVTLDEANGGIVRNLNDEVRVRFELRNPKLRVEGQGEVMWANSSGQCGIRFRDLSPRTTREINAWIFGDLLECAGHLPWLIDSADPMDDSVDGADDGLTVSAATRNVIQLGRRDGATETAAQSQTLHSFDTLPQMDWLSQPLSGKSLAWTVDSLMVLAALLLFSLVFLSVTHELPRWPWAIAIATAIFVSGFYWGFFQLCGGARFGERLARLVAPDEDDEDLDRENRFR